MAPYLGDFVSSGTVHFCWSTTDVAGASITRATNGTISVYKDNEPTQSVAGITDTEDFDGLTGVHACTIDLSADAFYAIESNYTVVLSGAVIDGNTINAVLAHFSIENRESSIGPLATEVHLCKAALLNKRIQTISTGVVIVYDDDGMAALATLTPSVDSTSAPTQNILTPS